MQPDEVYQSMALALRRAIEIREATERQLAEVRAQLAQLVEILIGQGALTDGHRRLLDKVGVRAGAHVRSRVKLRVLVDKYQVPGGDIDCEARLPLCHGRCCSFSFELTRQDLEEGVVRWEVEDPYVIRHEEDGYCSHMDRGTLGCTIYLQRPATCRGFDCRGDRRVWIDFDKRIPAPMPEGLRHPG